VIHCLHGETLRVLSTRVDRLRLVTLWPPGHWGVRGSGGAGLGACPIMGGGRFCVSGGAPGTQNALCLGQTAPGGQGEWRSLAPPRRWFAPHVRRSRTPSIGSPTLNRGGAKERGVWGENLRRGERPLRFMDSCVPLLMRLHRPTAPAPESNIFNGTSGPVGDVDGAGRGAWNARQHESEVPGKEARPPTLFHFVERGITPVGPTRTRPRWECPTGMAGLVYGRARGGPRTMEICAPR
jgi:hypothetical protein